MGVENSRDGGSLIGIVHFSNGARTVNKCEGVS